MRYLFAVLFAGLAVIALLLGAVSPASSEAITLRLRRYYLNSRDTLEVVCPMGARPVAQATFDTRSVQLRCVDDSLSPSPTPSAMPTHEHTSIPRHRAIHPPRHHRPRRPERKFVAQSIRRC
jgi:hypothetical protein